MKQRILFFSLLCAVALTANACSDDDNSSIKTYATGDFYNESGVRGVVFATSDEGRHGLIVSLDETIAAWSTEEVKTAAVSYSDGAANLAAIKSIADWQTKYPAFAWCAKKNLQGGTNWYLPAYEELRYLYKVWLKDKDAFNKVLTDNGGTAIIATSAENGYFWTSTDDDAESGTVFAIAYMFSQGADDYSYKTDANKVRAVHPF